jgi:hypothetical protein
MAQCGTAAPGLRCAPSLRDRRPRITLRSIRATGCATSLRDYQRLAEVFRG